MGGALGRGMTLVMSLWDDHDVNMLWLDSDYPTTADPSAPGVSRGTCATSSGKPSDVENNAANSSVTYSKIRTGEIGSTFSGNPGPSPPGPTGDKYKCDNNMCTKSTDGTGVDKTTCASLCGEGKYKCIDNKCTKSDDGTGVPMSTCSQVCGTNLYLQ